jgi:AcrR family transcriptional regulator
MLTMITSKVTIVHMKREEPSSRRPRKRRGYHHGDLKHSLIRRGLFLIHKARHPSFTIRDLARDLGVSHAAAYRHFPSKDALLAAIAEEGFRRLAAALRQAEEPPGKMPLEILLGKGLAYVGFARHYTGYFRTMFGAQAVDKSAFPALLQASTAAYESLRHTVVQCQRAGLLEQTDPDVISLVAWTVAHGLAALFVDEQLPGPARLPDLDPAELTAIVCKHALRGFIIPGGRHE